MRSHITCENAQPPGGPTVCIHPYLGAGICPSHSHIMDANIICVCVCVSVCACLCAYYTQRTPTPNCPPEPRRYRNRSICHFQIHSLSQRRIYPTAPLTSPALASLEVQFKAEKEHSTNPLQPYPPFRRWDPCSVPPYSIPIPYG